MYIKYNLRFLTSSRLEIHQTHSGTSERSSLRSHYKSDMFPYTTAMQFYFFFPTLILPLAGAYSFIFSWRNASLPANLADVPNSSSMRIS